MFSCTCKDCGIIMEVETTNDNLIRSAIKESGWRLSGRTYEREVISRCPDCFEKAVENAGAMLIGCS